MQMSTMDTETGEMIVKRVSVPIGLEELMEGLTKEILLKKPDDIYLFAAEYFAQLLLLREKGSYKAKTLKTAQSISKQIPKQPPEKLVVRGASKQLSRQISIRGESPVKRASPTKKPLPRNDHKDEKSIERNRFTDRKNKPIQTEPAEKKNVEAKPKHIISRTTSDNSDALNKRDRSLSSNRRGRSVTKSVQGTPRQKSTTPRRAQNTTENDKLNKTQSKAVSKHQTSNMQNEAKENPPVPKISSVEEVQGFIKDGKLTVTPPKIIKRPQVPEKSELVDSLVVPQVVENVASAKQNIFPENEVKAITLEVADLQETSKQKTNKEEKTHEEKDKIIEETNNKGQLNEINNKIINDGQTNEVVDETQHKINADLNTSPRIEKEISISIDDDKFSSETKSTSSIDGKATTTNLSKVNDENVNESKSIDIVEKHKDSPDVINTDNTSDDLISNLLTDDSSVSEILDKETKDTKLPKNDELLSNIQESSKESSSLNDTDNDSKIIKDKKNLTISVSDSSDKTENELISDHKKMLKSGATSIETQSEVVKKTIISEENETEDETSSKEESTLGSGTHTESPENNKLNIEIEKKNIDGSSSENALEEVLEKNVHQHHSYSNIKNDKEIKKDDKKEPIEYVREDDKIVFDSKEDFHNKNNINRNEETDLKQQPGIDKNEIERNEYSDKGVDVDKQQTDLHRNVAEFLETNIVDHSINNKDNVEDQTETSINTESGNIKDEAKEKRILEIQSTEKNMVNDINLKDVQNKENQPTRVKREVVALDDSEGDEITQATKSGENKVKNSNNLETDANKIENIKSQTITNEEESNDRPDEKQHDDAILPDSNKSDLKDKDEISESEEIPKINLTVDGIKLDNGKIDVNTEQEKSHHVTNIVSIDGKTTTSNEDDENTLLLTESDSEKTTDRESSGNNSNLTSPRTNENLTENVENISMTDKEHTKELSKENLVNNSTTQRDKDTNIIAELDKSDNDEMRDTGKTDNNNKNGANSMVIENTPMKECLDKTPRVVDDKARSVNNVTDTMIELEKGKTEKVLFEPNHEEIDNESDKEKTLSGSEKLNNKKYINQESEHSQKGESTTSTESIPLSGDVDENSDNKEAQKKVMHTKIEGQEANVQNVSESNINETEDKENLKETAIRKEENNEVLAENQSKNSGEEIVASSVVINHGKEAETANKEMVEDTKQTRDTTEEDEKLNNSDLSTSEEFDRNKDERHSSNLLLDSAAIDKTRMSNSSERKPNGPDLPTRNSKDDRTEIINSVINVAKEGPVDHVVKKYIGDFLQQEQQHVFVENANQQMKSKNTLDGSRESKEIAENILVERNEALTNEGNKSESSNIDTQGVDKDLTKNDTMKNIINSTVSLAQTGKVDEILKVHINDFLSNEKSNIFTKSSETISTSDCLVENDNKIAEANDKSLEADYRGQPESVIRKDLSKNLRQPETNSLSMKQNGKNIKSRSASQTNIKVPEESFKQNNKNKAEKKLRRVQTVDVLKDRNKPKPEVKSRIPTADYRNRIKREKENGHSVLIKQTSNSQEVVKKLPGKVIEAVNNIDENADSLTENKQSDEIVKDHLNENIEHKEREEAEVQQSSKNLKETEKYELNKSGFDNSKLREELNAVEAETKFATFRPTFNPYVLRQEIKDASLSDVNNKEMISNKELDHLVTQIAAALKIQSLWRGFKVRKSKAKMPPQQKPEPEGIKKNQESQLKLQADEKLNGVNIIENGISTDDINKEKIYSRLEKNENKQDLNRIIKPGSKEDTRMVQSGQNEDVEGSKISSQQKANMETISGNKDSPLELQADTNLKEKDTIKTDSSTTGKQDTDIDTDKNGSQSDMNRIIQSENNQNNRVKPLKNQESENQRNVKYPKVENIDEDSNKINENTFIEAAVMIQKIWRAFQVRKNMKQKYLEDKSSHKNNALHQGSTANNKVDAEKKPESASMELEKFIKAAIEIQKVWRGFKIRKNIKENYKYDVKTKDTELGTIKSREIPKQNRIESIESKIETKPAVDVKAKDTELDNIKSTETSIENTIVLTEPKIETQSANFSLQTDDKFRNAALIIQKIWRGFNARKIFKQNYNQASSKEDHQVKSGEHLIHINKEDNNKEAIKEVVNKKHIESLKSEVTPDISSELTDQNDSKFVRAATKIQTLWRGFKARKALKADNKQDVIINQGNIEHGNKPLEIATEKSEVTLKKESSTIETPHDEFVKAAIKIQKIWRGFKVRNVLKKGDLFGTRVESEKPVIESMKTAEEIHPKDKKSALKIQSLWRGYQVRKNINIIKDKLEEKIPANDVGKRKELTDEDILNAATKIQAGVRGYLQRKKYKRDVNHLNSIAEEESDEKYDAKKKDANSAPLTHRSSKDLEEEASSEKRQLSENEVFKALEDLNKLEIPSDIPVTNEVSKPKFYRSHTVQEPEIVKKQSSPLLQSASLSEIVHTQEDTRLHKNQSMERFKDSNNNSSDKFTPLEMEVKEVAKNITNTNAHELLSDTKPRSNGEVNVMLANTEKNSETLINKDIKQSDSDVQGNREENIHSKIKENKETENIMEEINKIQPSVNSNENILYESINQKSDTEQQVADNNDKKVSLTSTKSSSNISVPENQRTEVNKPVKTVSKTDNNHSLDLQHNNDKISSANAEKKDIHTESNIHKSINEANDLKGTDVNFDELNKKTDSDNLQSSTNKIVEVPPSEFVKDALSNDEQTDKTVDEKVMYERPVSIDSTDSAITVIGNELSGDYEEDSNEIGGEVINKLPERLLVSEDNSKKNLVEHENLIDDFQNKLLDQISGKNGDKTTVEEATKKFDIEQLRKELEEAGLIYNTDDTLNIQHQNSKEESNVHDQLFDYLHDLDSNAEEKSNINVSPRDLPDITEEDPDTKSDNIHDKSNTVLDSNTEANINESIKENVPKGGIDIEKLQSTLKECENIAHDINKDIKITETEQQPIEKKKLLNEVENNLTENKISTRGSGTNQIEPGIAFCATPQGKTFEDKHIDNKPLSHHTEEINVNTNSSIDKDVNYENNDEYVKSEADNIPTDLSSMEETAQTNSSSGRGLLHTGELHDSVLVSLPLTSETDSQEPDSLENMNTELSSQDDTLTSTALNPKLLHTGEFHDTVVVPLPEKVKSDLKTEIEGQGNSTSITHSISNNSEQLNITQTPLQPTRNIVSEELHFAENNLTSTGLLHTGELHDTVVVPLSIEAQHVQATATEENNIASSKSTEIIPSKVDLIQMKQLDQSTKEPQKEPSPPTYTRLLHTGELHDTVVLPRPAVDQPTIGKEDTETGSNQVENAPRQVDNESQTTGQVHAVPIEVQLNQAPAGVALMTSPRPVPAVHGVSSVEDDIAQTPDKGALPIESGSDFSSPSDIQSMESETRKNATTNNKSMEVEAATKIQAGFRGYQVRKQLKLKNGSSDINNQRRQLRRKSSGRITDNGRISQNKANPNDIEEKSAVKIQAGVRGFLVRRRQKKQKTQES